MHGAPSCHRHGERRDGTGVHRVTRRGARPTRECHRGPIAGRLTKGAPSRRGSCHAGETARTTPAPPRRPPTSPGKQPHHCAGIDSATKVTLQAPHQRHQAEQAEQHLAAAQGDRERAEETKGGPTTVTTGTVVSQVAPPGAALPKLMARSRAADVHRRARGRHRQGPARADSGRRRRARIEGDQGERFQRTKRRASVSSMLAMRWPLSIASAVEQEVEGTAPRSARQVPRARSRSSRAAGRGHQAGSASAAYSVTCVGASPSAASVAAASGSTSPAAPRPRSGPGQTGPASRPTRPRRLRQLRTNAADAAIRAAPSGWPRTPPRRGSAPELAVDLLDVPPRCAARSRSSSPTVSKLRPQPPGAGSRTRARTARSLPVRRGIGRCSGAGGGWPARARSGKRIRTRRAIPGLIGEPPARNSRMPRRCAPARIPGGSQSAPASMLDSTWPSSPNIVTTSIARRTTLRGVADQLDAVHVGKPQIDHQHHVGRLEASSRALAAVPVETAAKRCSSESAITASRTGAGIQARPRQSEHSPACASLLQGRQDRWSPACSAPAFAGRASSANAGEGNDSVGSDRGAGARVAVKFIGSPAADGRPTAGVPASRTVRRCRAAPAPLSQEVAIASPRRDGASRAANGSAALGGGDTAAASGYRCG